MPQGAALAVAKVVGTVVSTLGASAGAVSFAVQATFYLAQAAILAGINYGINALSRPKISRDLGTETDLQISSAFPRQMMIGERAIAGSLGPFYSYGPSNWGASIVYVIADHRITSLEKVYADGRLIRDTPLVHGVRTEIAVYNDGEAHMFMTWHDGRPGQSADAQLIANSAQDPDVVAGKLGGFTTDHKGAGVAYVHVELIFHPDYLVTPPKFLFHCKGAPLYDRRKDTTAGGSGAHRLDDPSTWEYTDNAAVALDHYLLGYKVEGDDRAFGVGLQPAEVPYATFAAAADLCDENVTTGAGGGEAVIKRYRANGMIGAERFFEDIVEELGVQMAARVVDLGGTVGIIGAEARTPVVALTDQDLVSDETIEYSDKQSFADRIGAVEGQFSDPTQLWEPDSYAPQRAADATLPDGGEYETLTLPLPFETNRRRAGRIARAILNRESLQGRLAASFMAKAWELEVGDWFTYSDDYLQMSDVEFEVIDIVKHADFSVTLTARLVDPDFVAFSVDDDPDLSVPPEFAPVSLSLEVPTLAYLAGAIANGGTTRPAIRLTVSDFDVLTREIHIEYRQWDGAALEDQGFTKVIRPDQEVVYLQEGLLPSQQYKIRVKATAGIKSSPWSAWSDVVTMSSTDEIASASIADGFIGQGALATLNAITNAYLAAGVGENHLINSDLNQGVLGFTAGSDTDSGLAISAGLNFGSFHGQRNVLYANLTGTPAGGTYFDAWHSAPGGAGGLTNLLRYALPVFDGDKVFARILAARHRVSSIQLYVFWYGTAGTLIDTVGVDSGGEDGGGTGGNPATFEELGGFVTAPAGARFATIMVRGFCAGTADPFVFFTEPMLGRAFPNQTEIPAYKPGPTDRKADATPENISAGFVGQNWGATASEAEARTSVGTAAAFLGQAWGATAAENAIRRRRSFGLCKNAFFEEPFSGSAIPPQWSDWSAGAGTFEPRTEGEGASFYLVGGAGANAGIQQQVNIAGSSQYLISAEVRRNAGSVTGAGVLVQFFNGGGGLLGQETLNFATDPNTSGAIDTAPVGPVRYEKIITTPSGTAYAIIYAFSHFSVLGSTAVANGLFWRECDLIPASLVAELRADRTANNSAASFYGQGTQAVANHYRGASYPGTPVEGSWWADTSTNQVKLYTGGAWHVVSDLGDGFSVSVSPGSALAAVHSGAVSTGNITATPIGGSSHTYFWERHSGDVFTITAPNSATTTFATTVAAGQTKVGWYTCTIRDGGTGKTVQVMVYIVLQSNA